MKKAWLYIAGSSLAIHGLIEALSFVFIGSGAGSAQKFIFDQLQNNLSITCTLGLVFGIVRIVAAAGIFANRMWGWALGVIASVVTYAIMTLYLPMGIADGILSGIALIALLLAYYGRRPIIE